MGKNTGELDRSTEEKIKAAAQKLFTQKGYAATKTRDIATEAGINLALLNYYFRSKERLFELIMTEHLQQFMQGLHAIFNDESTSIHQKIDLLVCRYIDELVLNPDIPIFILSELRNNPARIAERVQHKIQGKNAFFIKQLEDASKKGEIAAIKPIHIMANIISFTIFPFIASPILKTLYDLDQTQFNALMQERKKLIPQWIKQLLEPQHQLKHE